MMPTLLSAEPINTYSLRFTLSPGPPVIVIVTGPTADADRLRLLESLRPLLESPRPPTADEPSPTKTTKKPTTKKPRKD